MPNPKPLTAERMREVDAKRQRLGMTIGELAAAIGKPRNYHQVYCWLKGIGEPKAEMAYRLTAWLENDKHSLELSMKPPSLGGKPKAKPKPLKSKTS